MSIKGLAIKVTHDLSEDGQSYVMKQEYLIPYRASVNKQLTDWYNGISNHNNYSDECCPDFSCCRPELKWSHIEREEFLLGVDEVRQKLLMKALGALVGSAIEPKPTVYIAGVTPSDSTLH